MAKRNSVSIRPSDAKDITPDEHIANMSLGVFMTRTGAKMLENLPSEEWVETSSRPKIPGMMERYEDYCRGGGSVFNIFRVQERHWLAHCNTSPELSGLVMVYQEASGKLARSKYNDIVSYKGDVPDLFLGKTYGSPVNVKHHSITFSELRVFANALRIPPFDLVEIGRGWSLSTVIDNHRHYPYSAWSERIFSPIYDALINRAKEMVEAYNEALYLLHFRTNGIPIIKQQDKTQKGGA